jgi:serine phosphatase RsbU (regulator of sigma subunit)
MTPRPKILIVDDQPLNVEYLEQELEDLNYQAVTAANGLEALERIRDELPDMVLLDIMMPVMDGFEALKRLKADPAWRDIPVVIISAMTDLESVIKGIELGADDYLPKPFNPTLLSARLKSGLARKRLLDLEKVYRQSLERELEIGHQIQAGFLPGELPEVPGWEIAAHFQAAREVAGDFYDLFHLTDEKLGLFLGDVTDKGVGSALYMALYRSLLRAFMNAGDYLDEGQVQGDPAALLLNAVTRTNRYVCQTHDHALFATLFIAVLDLRSGLVSYINAGQDPALILSDTRSQQKLLPTGPGLGILQEMHYHVCETTISPTEVLLIYSDGVKDTQNASGAFFGNKRLFDLVAQPQTSASLLIERLSAALSDFQGDSSPYDDITLLAIKRK